MFGVSAGPTRPFGSAPVPELRTVMGVAAVQFRFGNLKVPSQVPPACKTTLSPHCAAFNAACRSPPVGTTIVPAEAEPTAPMAIMQMSAKQARSKRPFLEWRTLSPEKPGIILCSLR
jgi:hypothetical protein